MEARKLSIAKIFIAKDLLGALGNYVAIITIIIGGILISVNILHYTTLGPSATTRFSTPEPLVFLLTILAAFLPFPTLYRMRHFLSNAHHLFFVLFTATLLNVLLILIILRDVSLLQIVTFSISSLVIGWLVIAFPDRARLYGTIKKYLIELKDNRPLLHVMVKSNIRSRYSQTILGIIWILFLPLSLSMVYAFVFTQFFDRVVPAGIPFISFFLTATVAWDFFNQGLVTGTNTLNTNAHLIQQVYFPREILVLVKLGEDFVDFTFTFGAMVLINMAYGLFPTITWIYLIPVMAILTLLTLGSMLFLSYLSVFIRDISQLTAVFLRLLFFLTPILYTSDHIPSRFQFLMIINPLAPIIDAYRKIILLDQPPDITTLYYPLVVGCVLVYTGMLFFKMHERELADFI